MQFKGFFLLLLLTAAAVAGVYRFAFKPASEATLTADAAEASGYFLAEFHERASDLAEIAIIKADESITLELVGETWGIRERGGYPVDFAKVKNLAFALAQLVIEEPKTAKPGNHALLGVQAPDAEDSTSTQMILRDGAGAEMASFILGGRPQGRRGSQAVFVRRAAEDQVYLCAGKVTAASSVRSWVHPEILSLKSERVEDVRILHRDGEEVLIGRSVASPDELELLNVPIAREIAVAGNASSIGNALTRLTLEDVRPAGEIDFEAGALAETRYSTSDGLVLTITSTTFEDETWIKLHANFEAGPDEAPAIEAAEAGEEGDDSSTEDMDGNDPADVQAEVAELNARLGAWSFQIPSYKSNLIAKRLEDLLKNLDDSAEAKGAPGMIGDTEIPPNLQKLLEERGIGTAEFKAPDPVVEKPSVLPTTNPDLEPAESILPDEDPAPAPVDPTVDPTVDAPGDAPGTGDGTD